MHLSVLQETTDHQISLFERSKKDGDAGFADCADFDDRRFMEEDLERKFKAASEEARKAKRRGGRYEELQV